MNRFPCALILLGLLGPIGHDTALAQDGACVLIHGLDPESGEISGMAGTGRGGYAGSRFDLQLQQRQHRVPWPPGSIRASLSRTNACIVGGVQHHDEMMGGCVAQATS